MRIAVSGTHLTGKSTLVEALGARMPDHRTVPEPYEMLLERGYEFAHPPTAEDFVVQLKQSIASLRRRAPNMIFDRCPLDFVGYLAATAGGECFDVEAWRMPIAAAMATLDLVVSVRIDPAHDPVGRVEDAAYRADVDAWLEEIVDDDSLDLHGEVALLPLDGPWERRVDTVVAFVNELRARQ
jgi:hypothetical protein